MKKWFGVGIWTAVTVGCGVVAVVLAMNNWGRPVAREGFEFSSEVYEESGFKDITAEEFEQMVSEKKSFLVVLHMTVCPAEFPIRDVAKRLANEDGMIIYGLTEEEFRKTELAEVVKYLPSAALYQDGELVDYLDAEDDGDVEYYKSVEGLKEWIGI